TILTSRMEKGAWAFLFSSLTLACIILTAGIAMFPFVMPSSTMALRLYNGVGGFVRDGINTEQHIGLLLRCACGFGANLACHFAE
ncbi:hypothetical protein ONO12_27280, partial [Salmonella enterica subsp. enterica serovar Montevideo]|nr:hypothetical protein [Salmonella enterica subsp. enterica serovar Montevideo]